MWQTGPVPHSQACAGWWREWLLQGPCSHLLHKCSAPRELLWCSKSDARTQPPGLQLCKKRKACMSVNTVVCVHDVQKPGWLLDWLLICTHLHWNRPPALSSAADNSTMLLVSNFMLRLLWSTILLLTDVLMISVWHYLIHLCNFLQPTLSNWRLFLKMFCELQSSFIEDTVFQIILPVNF